jgi:hypothetical protein
MRMRRHSIAIGIALLGCGGGGDGRGTTAASAGEPAPIVASAGSQNGGDPPPPIPADAGTDAGSATAGEDIISVRPGFRPDPAIRTGTAGGPRDAETLDETCRGYIAGAPSHVLKVDAPVSGLRVLVAMRGDATLVIELADGRYLCNDDAEGLNPILTGPFPTGRHRVWVGTYSETPPGGVAYTIAFTADPSVSTTAIEGARPTS